MFYTEVKYDPTVKHNTQVLKALNNGVTKGHIDSDTSKLLKVQTPTASRFYMLPKIIRLTILVVLLLVVKTHQLRKFWFLFSTAVNKTAACCFVTSNIKTAGIIVPNRSNNSSPALDTDNYIYENASAYLSGYVAMNLCKPINKLCSSCLCKLKGKPDKSYYLKFISMKHFSYIKSVTVPSLELHTLLMKLSTCFNSQVKSFCLEKNVH